MKFLQLSFLLCMCVAEIIFAQSETGKVPDATMQKVYNKIATPYKYGLVVISDDDTKKTDSPGIFRKDGMWYMTYIIFDGRGYETWLAQSRNLLDWQIAGRIMSFSADTTRWDWNQKAGYIALQDTKWGGSYEWNNYNNKHWMSYIGGSSTGYEAGLLSIGIAFTPKDPSTVHEWQYLSKPVLMSTDKDVRWWENITQYKSSIIRDTKKLTGHDFVMFYNAKGNSNVSGVSEAERIGIAVSDDMVNWKRFLKDPVLDHHTGITGDAYLQKIDNLWVMFYFGAFWKESGNIAFNNFACSYDLINWTDWKGRRLIEPSEPYDELFAHKSYVIKWKGVVYHFYCAVNNKGQRGIAVATSRDLGTSSLHFPGDKKTDHSFQKP